MEFCYLINLVLALFTKQSLSRSRYKLYNWCRKYFNKNVNQNLIWKFGSNLQFFRLKKVKTYASLNCKLYRRSQCIFWQQGTNNYKIYDFNFRYQKIKRENYLIFFECILSWQDCRGRNWSRSIRYEKLSYKNHNKNHSHSLNHECVHLVL